MSDEPDPSNPAHPSHPLHVKFIELYEALIRCATATAEFDGHHTRFAAFLAANPALHGVFGLEIKNARGHCKAGLVAPRF